MRRAGAGGAAVPPYSAWLLAARPWQQPAGVVHAGGARRMTRCAGLGNTPPPPIMTLCTCRSGLKHSPHPKARKNTTHHAHQQGRRLSPTHHCCGRCSLLLLVLRQDHLLVLRRDHGLLLLQRKDGGLRAVQRWASVCPVGCTVGCTAVPSGAHGAAAAALSAWRRVDARAAGRVLHSGLHSCAVTAAERLEAGGCKSRRRLSTSCAPQHQSMTHGIKSSFRTGPRLNAGPACVSPAALASLPESHRRVGDRLRERASLPMPSHLEAGGLGIRGWVVAEESGCSHTCAHARKHANASTATARMMHAHIHARTSTRTRATHLLRRGRRSLSCVLMPPSCAHAVPAAYRCPCPCRATPRA